MGNTSHLREQSGFAAHSTRTAAVSLASNNQKRTFNLAALVALALAALLAVFGTAAFTVGAAPADNVITFGSVKMRVCEFTLNDSGSEVPFEASASGDYPATKVSSGGDQPYRSRPKRRQRAHVRASSLGYALCFA